MRKQILVTNDDGIGADGLRKLVEIACRLGDVTVVAPDAQRSAASHHCIFNRKLLLRACDFGLAGAKAYTLDGTPADCVRVGIFAAAETRPDVVLSGINHGYNISSDIQYSGTVGAALEAAFLGVPAIAVSYGNPEFRATDIVDRFLPAPSEEYMEQCRRRIRPGSGQYSGLPGGGVQGDPAQHGDADGALLRRSVPEGRSR